jgi:hypothetical protein
MINNKIFFNNEYEREFSHLLAKYGVYNDLKTRKESGNCLSCRCLKCRGKSDIGSCQYCSNSHSCKHHLYKDEYCLDCGCVNCHNNRGTIFTRNLVDKLNDKHQIYKFDQNNFYKDDKSFINSYKTPYALIEEEREQQRIQTMIDDIGINQSNGPTPQPILLPFDSTNKRVENEKDEEEITLVIKRDSEDYFHLPDNRVDKVQDLNRCFGLTETPNVIRSSVKKKNHNSDLINSFLTNSSSTKIEKKNPNKYSSLFK